MKKDKEFLLKQNRHLSEEVARLMDADVKFKQYQHELQKAAQKLEDQKVQICKAEEKLATTEFMVKLNNIQAVKKCYPLNVLE